MKNTLLKLHAHKEKLCAAAISGLFTAAAYAQSDPFATTVSEVKTKIGEYGAALVGVAAVGVIFSIAIKYVKKIPRSS